MTRRADLPGAAELFRSTSAGRAPALPDPAAAAAAAAAGAPPVRTVGAKHASGRERHEEKITVYCSVEELVGLEAARLALRADYGITADRGRIVREAVTLALAELAGAGAESGLVRRLRDAAGAP
jgi:hypothetical protein